MPGEYLGHILLTSAPTITSYTTPQSGGGDRPRFPERRRESHARRLLSQLDRSYQSTDAEALDAPNGREGVYLEFRSALGYGLAVESLENLSKDIRLLNVRTLRVEQSEEPINEESPVITLATVFVPNPQRNFFLHRINEYLQLETARNRPRNEPLIASIDAIEKAIVESFWIGDVEDIPRGEEAWLEVWLKKDTAECIRSFNLLLQQLELLHSPEHVVFPERIVMLVKANYENLSQLLKQSDDIAEFRLAVKANHSWIDEDNAKQVEAVEELLQRTICIDSNTTVCILDTGVNNTHALLQPILATADCMSLKPEWGNHDHHGHGTLMAGTIAYGDLSELLGAADSVEVLHKLESVKLMPPPPESNDPQLYAYFTSQAVSISEINNPGSNRIFSMAITASEYQWGTPSSWSAAVDQLTSGGMDDKQRLMIVSAGNVIHDHWNQLGTAYHDLQLSSPVQDPGQSWNCITVGAYTNLTEIHNPDLAGYQAVAPKNGLSPFSTTSLLWDENKWPVKPELLLEGGNLAIDGAGFVTEDDDLSILSTFYQPQQGQFYCFNMTSSATALLSGMAGRLQALNPNYWPETIRALLIHSADWPSELKQQFMADESKTSYKRLLKICGYGIPNEERAIYSSSNHLTLISQQEIQPFDRAPNGRYITKDMHMHVLPWPKELLLELPPQTNISMRVTLSYFIEPSPGEIGWKNRYRYASHGLRFELIAPDENPEEFQRRINRAARDEEDGEPRTASPADHWMLGSQARDRGSVHSDIWKGTAAELAASNLIAIMPTIGWWRERHHLGRWNKLGRYSLVVSIDTPEVDIDVYTPVANMLRIPIEILN